MFLLMNPSFQGTYQVSYLQVSILRVQRLFKRTAQRIILNRGTCLLSALPSPGELKLREVQMLTEPLLCVRQRVNRSHLNAGCLRNLRQF